MDKPTFKHSRKRPEELARTNQDTLMVDKSGRLRSVIQKKRVPKAGASYKDVMGTALPRLTPDLIEACLEYVRLAKDVETHDEKGSVVRIDAKYPNIAGMAMFVGINSKTLQEYAKRSPGLQNVIAQLKDTQEDRLLQMGLSGKYNTVIGKLVLMNHHNYKEKADYTTDISITDVVKQDRAEFAAEEVRY